MSPIRVKKPDALRQQPHLLGIMKYNFLFYSFENALPRTKGCFIYLFYFIHERISFKSGKKQWMAVHTVRSRNVYLGRIEFAFQESIKAEKRSSEFE